MISPSLVHNGDHIASKSFLECYTAKRGSPHEPWQTTPPGFGEQPIPSFPQDWEPAKNKAGNFTFSQKNPFNLANFSRRREAGEKVAYALKKWGMNQGGAKGDRILKLAYRVKKCQNIATCVDADGAPVGGENGGAYFRSERCNSRFCPRCARKCSKATMKRLCARLGFEPESPPDNMRFLTLTLPGGAGESLKSRVKCLRSSLARLYRSTLWKNRIKGSIGKIEVTKNGPNWHVHSHFLVWGDYLENDALKVVWAECLRVDYKKINLPWITKPLKGSNSLKEICKYFQKPVAFLGSKKKGIAPWSQNDMQEFFTCFLSARVFMTTGKFEALIEADKKRKEKEGELSAIVENNPERLALAKAGESCAIAEIENEAAAAGFTRADVRTEIALGFFDASTDPPVMVGEWTTGAAEIDAAREAQALWWERRQIFWEELKNARRECFDAIRAAA